MVYLITGSYWLLAFAATIVATGAGRKVDSKNAPTAAVINGTYKGVYNGQFHQDYFLGIPFALPPTNDLRLQIPHSLNTTWSGSRNATEYGPICLGSSQKGNVSEDCLSLNVVRPARVKEGDNLPVAGKQKLSLYWKDC